MVSIYITYILASFTVFYSNLHIQNMYDMCDYWLLITDLIKSLTVIELDVDSMVCWKLFLINVWDYSNKLSLLISYKWDSPCFIHEFLLDGTELNVQCWIVLN